MSGLVGLATFDGRPVDPRMIDVMAQAAPHRHPDGVEAWVGEGAAFGYQRRLVLAGGTDARGLAERGGLVCVADARLDNRPELVAALRSREIAIADDASEAELILAAFVAWEEHCASHLLGDFAFVVWDAGRRRLCAARDPMAMRSLAYHLRPGRSVAVATEVKQLLALPYVPVRLHEAAVLADIVATFGEPSWTFHEEIHHVQPGHVLVVDAAGAREARFWAPDPTIVLRRTEAHHRVALLRARFLEAVAARLRTGWPAGVLLSGGVDSGSVGASGGWLLRQGAVPAPGIHAVSWAFDLYAECDERAISSLIADHYGLPQIDVSADEGGPLAGYPLHGPDRDEPFLGAFQPIIEQSLAAAAASGVRVLLGGDRGDLVMGPTGWSHLRLVRSGRWRELGSSLIEQRRELGDPWPVILRRNLVRPAFERLVRRSPWDRLRRRGFDGVARAGAPPPWVRCDSPALEAALSSGEIRHRPAGFESERALRYDSVFTQLHVRGMAWSERTYARAGIGFADPFSDRRVVELALALPQVVINRPGDDSKPLMRAAMRGVVPEPARRLMRKTLPTALYEGSLRERAGLVASLLERPRVADHGWVDADGWRAEYEDWLARRGPLSAEWWWTLSVELWLREYW